jgi:hypothetical protein
LEISNRGGLLDRELSSLRQELATEYARRNGWKYIDKSARGASTFNLKALREGKVWAYSRHEGYGLDSSSADHPDYFRTTDSRAAAIIGHSYNLPGHENNFEKWALSQGLEASFPDYPSWYSPRRTKIVTYTRADIRTIKIESMDQLQQYLLSTELCYVKIPDKILFTGEYEIYTQMENKQRFLKHWRVK